MDELIKKYADKIVIDLEGDLDGVDFYEYMQDFAEEIKRENKANVLESINHNLASIAKLLNAIVYESADGSRCYLNISGDLETYEQNR